MNQERIEEYYRLLQKIAADLQDRLQKRADEEESLKMTGAQFEKEVYDALRQAGIKEEHIKHSSQRFPDFIITDPEEGDKLGLEVKKTDSSKWEVIGGSIYESLKNDIDETYLIMGRFGESRPEVRIRKYEECISDLKVTHSPRFHLMITL